MNDGKTETSQKKEKGVKRGISGSKSIKKTLLASIIGLSVAITLLCGIASAVISYKDALSNMKIRLLENTTAYCSSVQNAIEIYKSRIYSVSQDQAVTDANLSDEARQKALTKLSEKNGFVKLDIADSKGQSTSGEDVSQQDYFKEAMSGNTYISSTMVSSSTGNLVLTVAAPLTRGGENLVVYATLDAETFSKMIDAVAIGKSGYGFITDKDGKYIAHKVRSNVTDQVNYIEKAKTDSSLGSLSNMVQGMISGKTGITKIQLHGAEQVVSYMPIPDTGGWAIGVTARTSEMLGSFYVSIAITASMMLFFILLSIAFAFRISRPIVDPIVALVNRIEALAEGDLHSEVPQVATEDEIGKLSKSFTLTVNWLKGTIEELSFILTSLEQGDCTVETKQEYSGDFISMKDSLNRIVQNLNSVFTMIKNASDQVAVGSQQVSGASQSLASGAAEQASTVEELNASITGVARQAEENVTNVRKATEYVSQADAGINESNERMKDLNAAMRDISESSERISSITKVIEDIAFQTNILALNAAIEAARAGEAGKGFAVVADEVRNLAAKSAEAAKETAQLIQHSSETVLNGEKIARETAGILVEMAEKAKLADQSIQKIEAASVSQAQAIEQINQGLFQVSAVVQTNAATAEESSASSEELAAQAQALQREVNKFRLKEEKDAPSGPVSIEQAIPDKDFWNSGKY